jgi:hypothetical protein
MRTNVKKKSRQSHVSQKCRTVTRQQPRPQGTEFYEYQNSVLKSGFSEPKWQLAVVARSVTVTSFARVIGVWLWRRVEVPGMCGSQAAAVAGEDGNVERDG